MKELLLYTLFLICLVGCMTVRDYPLGPDADRPQLNIGEPIRLITNENTQHEGTVLAVEPDSVRIVPSVKQGVPRGAEQLAIAYSDISSVSRHEVDSITTTLLGIGLLLGVLTFVAAKEIERDPWVGI